MVNTIIQKREFLGYDLNWIFRQDKNRNKFYCCDNLKDDVVKRGDKYIVNKHGLTSRESPKDRITKCPFCNADIIYEDNKITKVEEIKKFNMDDDDDKKKITNFN